MSFRCWLAAWIVTALCLSGRSRAPRVAARRSSRGPARGRNGRSRVVHQRAARGRQHHLRPARHRSGRRRAQRPAPARSTPRCSLAATATPSRYVKKGLPFTSSSSPSSMDVDEPGRAPRRALASRPSPRDSYLIVSQISGRYVLAHKLENMLGNPEHSDIQRPDVLHARRGHAVPRRRADSTHSEDAGSSAEGSPDRAAPPPESEPAEALSDVEPNRRSAADSCRRGRCPACCCLTIEALILERRRYPGTDRAAACCPLRSSAPARRALEAARVRAPDSSRCRWSRARQRQSQRRERRVDC